MDDSAKLNMFAVISIEYCSLMHSLEKYYPSKKNHNSIILP